MKSVIRLLAFSAAMGWAAFAYGGAARVGNAYYEDLFTQSTCPVSNGCYYYSTTPTPTNAYVRITHLLASFDSPGKVETAELLIFSAPPTTSGSSILKRLPLAVPQPSAGYYTIAGDTLLLAGPGRYLVVLAQGSTNSAVVANSNCGVTGDLITP